MVSGAMPFVGFGAHQDQEKPDSEPIMNPISKRSDRLGKLGVQLYTVRDLMDDNLEKTLSRVASIGYEEVEFADYFDHAPEELASILGDVGLDSPATHVSIQMFDNHLESRLEFAEALGHRYLICPYIPEEQRRTLDDYRSFADRFNGWGDACASAGLQFAFHNHDFEFVEIDGVVPFDILLDRCDPELVTFEIDLFWITKAGKDPLAYFEEHPGRFELCHVKDMAPDGSMTEVGQGQIDFGEILARADQAGLQYFFVEHDKPDDALASISQSFEGIRRLLNP
jgi:sugar phosphate isomerase/epimerase